jgi:hypothetical protein
MTGIDAENSFSIKSYEHASQIEQGGLQGAESGL